MRPKGWRATAALLFLLVGFVPKLTSSTDADGQPETGKDFVVTAYVPEYSQASRCRGADAVVRVLPLQCTSAGTDAHFI